MLRRGSLLQSSLFLAVFTLFAGPGVAARIRALAQAAQGVDRNQVIDPRATVAAERSDFDFRSGFWMNLHHFLYLQAVLATEVHPRHAETAARDAAGAPAMSAAQKAAWDRAVSYYKQFGKLIPLESRQLADASYELSDAGNSASLAGRKLLPEMKRALEEAAPVYRALWWKQQDHLNRQWIAGAAKLGRQYGSIGPRIASLFKTEWPREKTRVEVVVYANFGGAYTMTKPTTLITISSSDPGNQGYAALESLFHEASHALIDTLQQRLASRLHAAGKTPTFQFIHVIIFYTAGEMTSETLKRNGIQDYVPYADEHGLYTGAWAHYRDICQNDWQPYIDGKIDFDEALSRIAHDF